MEPKNIAYLSPSVEMFPGRHHGKATLFSLIVLIIAGGGIVTSLWYVIGSGPDDSPALVGTSYSYEPVDELTVRQLCSYCHVFPEYETLPRAAWRKAILEMGNKTNYGLTTKRLDPSAVASWFEDRAPEQLSFERGTVPVDSASLPLKKREFVLEGENLPADLMVSNVKFVDLTGDSRLEILVCEMRNGMVLTGKPYEKTGTLKKIGSIPNPAHAEITDLNGDGLPDVLVANLGSYLPRDHNLGSVEWLRQKKDGTFERITLQRNLGRVADVRAADFDNDGDLDLVVAEFGWRDTGRVLILENFLKGDKKPRYLKREIDRRHGAIHVIPADLNNDGLLDIVALLAQEHEMVIAYINDGGLRFHHQILYRAPHPSWGFSGMELVDLDQDHDLDVLITNGDTLDDGIPKPYHGIHWLENKGNLQFQEHLLVRMYGTHRAMAADMDGDGDLDIVACSFIDQKKYDDLKYISFLWLEQTEPGQFESHALEPPHCRHPTLDIGDYDLDGDMDVILGNAGFPDSPVSSMLDIWENPGND